MLIIPSIDIYENKIVRLTKGSFDNITYYKSSPINQAKLYESLGFKLIHVVDLDGAKEGKFAALKTIEEIKNETDLKIQFGGGIRDVKTATEVFSAGVDFAVIGSLSIKNKTEFELIIKEFTADKIVCAVDVLDDIVQISGWQEETTITVYDHIEYCIDQGIEIFLCTDISKDGMLTGANLDLYKKLSNKYSDINLIASGGVKDIEDIKKLKLFGLYAAIVGKAIYEEKIDLEELASLVE